MAASRVMSVLYREAGPTTTTPMHSYALCSRPSSPYAPTLAVILLFAGAASAQVVLAPGSLMSPIGIIADHQDQLWIGESGDGTGNTGRVSRYNPTTGALQTQLVGFPSELIEGQPTGVHHLAWDPQNAFALNIALGGTNGHLQTWDVSTGTLIPGEDYDVRSYAIAQGLPAGAGQPDSNIYSVAVDAAGDHYVVDAGANAIIKVDAAGSMSVFAQFPNFPSLGPPYIGQQAVPTKILLDGAGGFWVCNLTGGPFFAGVASVFHVDSAGVVLPVQTGFTTLVDMAIDPTDGNLVVLSWGQFDLQLGNFVPFTGTITKLTNTGTSEIASGLMLPTGMAYTSNGDLYVHSYAMGSLEKIPSANATSYGSGCGSPALEMLPTGMPVIGGFAAAAIQNAPGPPAIGAVALGFSNTSSMGNSLPIDLTSFGMAGCQLWQSGEVVGLLVTPNLGSMLQFSTAIPNDPLLVGLHFYTQAFCVASGQNALGVIVSNGVDWRIGNP